MSDASSTTTGGLASAAPGGHRGLSVVVPSFNSAPWLESTLRAVDVALVDTAWEAEIVVVDDGSTDDTPRVLAALAEVLRTPLRVVRTENQGRFLARWAGTEAATYPEILLLDSRVLVEPGALAHVLRTREEGGHGPWNAHVETSTRSSLVGLFWEVPTYVFWGAYRARPRPMLITPENFDHVPKGTTCFLVDREVYQAAARACWPQENAHLVSDDTMLLRYIAARFPIRIDPGFAVEYRPRQSLRRFLAHSYVRGTLFVSSYAGTSRLRDVVLVLLALSVPAAVVALVAAGLAGALVPMLVAVLGIASAAALVPSTIALARGCPPRAALAFVVTLVPFGAVFWAGLVRGLVVHRRTWRRHG